MLLKTKLAIFGAVVTAVAALIPPIVSLFKPPTEPARSPPLVGSIQQRDGGSVFLGPTTIDNRSQSTSNSNTTIITQYVRSWHSGVDTIGSAFAAPRMQGSLSPNHVGQTVTPHTFDSRVTSPESVQTQGALNQGAPALIQNDQRQPVSIALGAVAPDQGAKSSGDATASAHAENHALILWIGDYGDPRYNLPGIDVDATLARQIAAGMGVPAANITEISNAQLSRRAVAQALDNLRNRIAEGDGVFIYYSGHGMRVMGVGDTQCAENLVTREPALFDDLSLQTALTAIGRKTSRLILMTDASFSDGPTTGRIRTADADVVPKIYRGEAPVGRAVFDSRQCGNSLDNISRSLLAAAAQPLAPQVLYIGASAADQASMASPRGSLATRAWAQCTRTGDADQSGAVDANELRACAQHLIDSGGGKQTIVTSGNTSMPLTFIASSGGKAAANVSPVRTLGNILAMSSPAHKVTLRAALTTLRIGQDEVAFNVYTSRAGYLYVIHVGSDGKTFQLLFPNRLDANHRVEAGAHQLPRPSWRLVAAGPAGTSHIMALVSPRPLELSKGMEMSSPFPHAAATADTARNVLIALTGQFGASEVVALSETK
jgi:hypothetical protein